MITSLAHRIEYFIQQTSGANGVRVQREKEEPRAWYLVKDVVAKRDRQDESIWLLKPRAGLGTSLRVQYNQPLPVNIRPSKINKNPEIEFPP